MKTNRRKFISKAFLGGLVTTTFPLSEDESKTITTRPLEDIKARYAKLDEILNQPVFKKELFSAPVIIEVLELLRLNNSFLCRVRSKDGAVGISVANDEQMRSLYPVFVSRLQPFFIGKDARNLESLIEEVYVYQSNYKMQSLALWVPLATIEFAILDMMGNISEKSIGQLIGGIYNPQVAVYSANGDRDISVEETMKRIQKEVEESKAKAIKLKVGGRMSPGYHDRKVK
jgi:L-alanine-DL-glutamate epimerase-like enolase superfamily enzyme